MKAADGTEWHHERNVMRFFPRVFTMASFMLFMLPSYLAVRTDRDPVVAYWKGYSDLVLLIIPVIILAAHIYHANYGPSKYVTTAAAMIPGMLLVAFGLKMQNTNPAGSLFSIDCDLMPEKMHLQQEWEAAHSLYQSCLKQTSTQHNFTVDYLAQNFRIQDCTEYPKGLEKHMATWSYLRYLEEKTHCTGFCIPGQPLWTAPTSEHKDSCAVAVASAFTYMAHPHSVQVFILSAITTGLVAVLMIILVPLLTKYEVM